MQADWPPREFVLPPKEVSWLRAHTCWRCRKATPVGSVRGYRRLVSRFRFAVMVGMHWNAWIRYQGCRGLLDAHTQILTTNSALHAP